LQATLHGLASLIVSEATDGIGVPGPPEGPSTGRKPSVDDTAAFQRFYLDEQLAASASAPVPTPPTPSLFHRLFVGWWRDRRS
jgi:hypothetical protein